MLESEFPTLILTIEAIVLHLFAVAAIFFEILEFYGEFYEIEFYNSIQDIAFTTVYWLQRSAWLSILFRYFTLPLEVPDKTKLYS